MEVFIMGLVKDMVTIGLIDYLVACLLRHLEWNLNRHRVALLFWHILALRFWHLNRHLK